jgi:hypothetical protein
METIMDATILKIIFLVAPLCSLLIAYTFFSKDSHDQEHFFHVFSVSYLATLAFREIGEIINNRLDWWVIIFFAFLVMILLVKDWAQSKSNWNILSHHHHKEFSYLLGGLFIFHSFVDGLLFGSGEVIQSGLILHRLIDGFVIFGLIGGTSGGIRAYKFFKKENLLKTFIMVLFIAAPLLGLYLPEWFKIPFWGVLQNICFFLLAALAVLDIETEFLHRHGVPSNRFFVAIFFALVLGLSIAH